MKPAPNDQYRNHECNHPDEIGRVVCKECGLEMQSEDDFMSVCVGAPKRMRYAVRECVDGTKLEFPIGVK